MEKMNRSGDLIELLKKLDLTPTMYQYAVDRYDGITTYLQEQGIKADIYPQGSFRLGTTIRPLREGKEAEFDLDVVCELSNPKSITTPRATKHMIGDILKGNKIYADKMLPEDDRCWTLEYAELNGEVGFVLDIVPAVHEDEPTIKVLTQKNVQPNLANDAIAITEKSSTNQYIWQNSNPKGYAKWFDEINAPFLQYQKDERRQVILQENKQIFASVEDIPDSVDRSVLQRVIQLLKRHRDIYYSSFGEDGWNRRPISAILTTLTAQIAQHASVNLDLVELLHFVSHELITYAELLDQDHLVFKEHTQIPAQSYIKKEDQKWKILNPVNPSDNFADAWDNDTATMFFRWVQAVSADFVDSKDFSDDQYYAILENSMGKDLVNNSLQSAKKEHKTITITSPSKPWGV